MNTPWPCPDDIVDEAKLERVRRRLGFTVDEIAQLVGVSESGFGASMGYAPKGWRARVEAALDLKPGELSF